MSIAWVLALAFFAAAAWVWALPNQVGRFRCVWHEAQCIVESHDGSRRTVPLGSIQRAYVSNSRALGNSLVLLTDGGALTLSKASLHQQSRREYYAAAASIMALRDQGIEAIDVSFTYRSGFMPGAALAFFGILCALLGGRSLLLARRADA